MQGLAEASLHLGRHPPRRSIPHCSPSSDTTGITSRTLERVNTSPAANTPLDRERVFHAPRIPCGSAAASRLSRVTPARIPRSSAGVHSYRLRGTRGSRSAPRSTIPSEREEDRVVAPRRLRLALRRHVDGVAGRFHPGQQPGRGAPCAGADRQRQRSQRHAPLPLRLQPVRQRGDQREPDAVSLASRPPVHTTRSSSRAPPPPRPPPAPAVPAGPRPATGRPSTSADPASRARWSSSRNVLLR